jgi:hypothetical protein
MSTFDYVEFRLRKMRDDTRKRVAREIRRQLAIAKNNGGFGTFQMYAVLERAATDVYAAALNDAARLLLNAKGDAAALERFAVELAATVVDELEWRRGRILNGTIRRVRGAMERTRQVVVELFCYGVVEGRPWPP